MQTSDIMDKLSNNLIRGVQNLSMEDKQMMSELSNQRIYVGKMKKRRQLIGRNIAINNINKDLDKLEKVIENYKIQQISYMNPYAAYMVKSQMDSVSVGNDMSSEQNNDQTSMAGPSLEAEPVLKEVEENTAEITDTPKNVASKLTKVLHSNIKFNSSLASNTRKFNSSYLTNRWINLPVVKLQSSDALDSTIKTYDIVQDLFTHLESTNINISKNFSQCAPNVKMRFIVNTNQFVQGAYLIAYQYGFQFQQENKRQDMQALVNLWQNGQSQLLDLNKGNVVEFDIPYFNFLNYGATIGSDQTLKNVGNAYCTLFIKCLVPLGLASSQCETQVSLTPAFMFKDINATGMIPNAANKTALFTSRPGISATAGSVISQMDDVERMFGKLKFNNPAIQMAEKGLKMVGELMSADKPLTTSVVGDVVIRETTNTASGVGVENALSMRLDPTGTTSLYYPYREFPTLSKISELACSNGFYNVVNLNICEGDRDHKYLFSLPVELMNEDLQNNRNTILMYPWQSKDDFVLREFIPRGVNVAMMFSQMYRGSLEYTFYSVQTNFHSFSLLIAYVPYDTTGPITFEQAQACEHVIVNFSKEARSYKYTIPYINQTTWRKCKPYNMTSPVPGDKIGNDGISYGSVVVFQFNRGSVSNVCATNVSLIISVQASPEMEFMGNRSPPCRYTSQRRNEEAIDFYPKNAFGYQYTTLTKKVARTLYARIVRIGESVDRTLQIWLDYKGSVDDPPEIQELVKVGTYAIDGLFIAAHATTVSSTAVGWSSSTGSLATSLPVNTNITLEYTHMPATGNVNDWFGLRVITKRPNLITNVVEWKADRVLYQGSTVPSTTLTLTGVGIVAATHFTKLNHGITTRAQSQGLFEVSESHNTVENSIAVQAMWSTEKSLDLMDLAKRWKMDRPIILGRTEDNTYVAEELYNRTSNVGVQCQYLSDYATDVNVTGFFGSASQEYSYGRNYQISALDWLNNTHLYYRGGYRRKLIFPKEIVHNSSNSDVLIARGYKNYQITWIPPSDYCFPKAMTQMNADYHDTNFSHNLDEGFLQYFNDPFNGSMPSQIVSTNVNNIVSIDMPFYSIYNFIPCNKLISSVAPVETAHVLGMLAVRSIQDNAVLYSNQNNNAPTDNPFEPYVVLIQTMHALGDDGSFYGFWGFPRIQAVTSTYNSQAQYNLDVINPIITVNPTGIVAPTVGTETSANWDATDVVTMVPPVTVKVEEKSSGEKEVKLKNAEEPAQSQMDKMDYISLVNHWCQVHSVPMPSEEFVPTQELQWKCNLTLQYHSGIYATAQGNTKKVAKNNAFKNLYNKLITRSQMDDDIPVSTRNRTLTSTILQQEQDFNQQASSGGWFSSLGSSLEKMGSNFVNVVGNSKVAVAATSLVNPGLAIGITAAKANASLNKLDLGLDRISSTMDQASNHMGEMVRIAHEIKDSICRKVNWIKDKGITIFNSILTILNIVTSKTYVMAAINITSLLVSLGVVLDVSFQPCVEFLRQWLGLSSTEQQSDDEPVRSQSDFSQETILGLGGAVLSIVLASIGVGTSVVKNIPVLKILHTFGKYFTFRNIKDVFMCFNSVGIFLKSIQDMFFDALNLIKSYIPAYNLDVTFINDMPDVKKWMQDIDILCDARTSETINSVGYYKDRLWMAVSRAHYYRQLLGTGAAPEALKKLNHHVLKYCDRICKLADTKKSVLSCSPVRYEPFVINVYGGSNIGKSFISEEIIVRLLEHVGVEYAGNPVYVRTPGVPYWNMFTTQPAVMMDDWLAVKGETFAQTQISELFNLKSTATFNPNMAAIENKEIRANPLIVYLSSNHAFPPLEGVLHPEAVYRRRDVLIEARIKEGFLDLHNAKEVKDLPREVLENFDHLEFSILRNVKNPNNSEKTQFMSYHLLMQTLKIKFREYHVKEIENVKNRMERLNILLPEGMKAYIPNSDVTLAIRSRLDAIATLVGMENRSVEEVEQDLSFLNSGIEQTLAKLGNFSKKFQELQISRIEDEMHLDMNMMRRHFGLPMREYESEHIPYVDGTKDTGTRLLASEVRKIDRAVVQESAPSTSQDTPVVMQKKKKKQKAKSQMFDTVREIIMRGIDASVESAYQQEMDGLDGDCCHICLSGVNEENEHIGGLEADYVCSRTSECGNHIVCVDCGPAFEASTDISRRCPECRSGMIKIDRTPKTLWSYVRPEFWIGKGLLACDNLYCRLTGNMPFLLDYISMNAWDLSFKITTVLSFMVAGYAYYRLVKSISRFTESLVNAANRSMATGLHRYNTDDILAILRDETNPHFALVDQICTEVFDDLSISDANRLGILISRVNTGVFGQIGGDAGCSENCKFDCTNTPFRYSAERLTSLLVCNRNDMLRTNINNTKKCSMYDVNRMQTINVDQCKHPDLISNIRNYFSDVDEDVDNMTDEEVMKEWSIVYLQQREDWGYIQSLQRQDYYEWYGIDGTNGKYMDCICNDNCVMLKFREYLLYSYCKKILIRDILSSSRHVPPEILLTDSLYSCRGTLDRYDAYFSQVREVLHKPWYQRCGEIILKYWQSLKLIGYMGAAFITMYATYKFSSYLFGSETIQSQLIGSGGSRIMKAPRSIIKMNQGRVSSQGGDNETYHAILKHVVNNSVYIRTSNGKVMRAMGIVGRYFVFNNHFYQYLKLRPELELEITNMKAIKNNQQQAWIPYKLQIVEEWEDQDIIICRIPNQIPMFKNIIPYILSEKQHENILREATMVEYNLDFTNIHYLTIEGVKERLSVAGGDDNQGKLLHADYIVTQAYVYNVQGPGKCGSIGMLPNNQTPLFSFHTAGKERSNRGYGVPLVREWFEKFEKEVKVVDRVYGQINNQESRLKLSDEHYRVTTLVENIPFVPNKSSIIQSKIAGILKDTDGNIYTNQTEPAMLSKTDPRWSSDVGTPLSLGVEKTGLKNVLEVEEDIHQQIMEYMGEEMINKVKPVLINPSSTNVKTAILGIPGIPFFEKLDFNTSAGYPFSQTKSKKTAWITVEDDDVKLDPYLLNVLEVKSKQRKDGIVPLTVFMDCLKDERLPIAKARTPGKTRIFSLSPLDFTIQCRQYFLHYVAAFQNSRLEYNHSVGIAADGCEWGCLISKLQRMNKEHVITGDYSGFGHTLLAQATIGITELINNWYRHYNKQTSMSDCRTRNVMGVELSNALHVASDVIFECGGGCPSGSPLTVVYNSLVNMYYINWAWLNIMKNTPYHGLSNIDKYVYYSVYGDDLIMAVHPEVENLFNNITISNIFKKINIEFTDATKQGNVKWETYANATFLKRGFKVHPTRKCEYLAPLSMESVKDCAFYIYKSASDLEATKINADQSLRLAYGHGPEFFKQWKKCINDALEEIGVQRLTLTWEECDINFFEEGQIMFQFNYKENYKNKRTTPIVLKEYYILKIEGNKIVDCAAMEGDVNVPLGDLDLGYINEMSGLKYTI